LISFGQKSKLHSQISISYDYAYAHDLCSASSLHMAFLHSSIGCFAVLVHGNFERAVN